MAVAYYGRGVIAHSDEIIKASADSLGKHGFINYFGLQVRDKQYVNFRSMFQKLKSFNKFLCLRMLQSSIYL